jgi:hypothetical protein
LRPQLVLLGFISRRLQLPWSEQLRPEAATASTIRLPWCLPSVVAVLHRLSSPGRPWWRGGEVRRRGACDARISWPSMVARWRCDVERAPLPRTRGSSLVSSLLWVMLRCSSPSSNCHGGMAEMEMFAFSSPSAEDFYEGAFLRWLIDRAFPPSRRTQWL